MRLATLGFHHESNTFAPVPADLERWRRAGILEGAAIRAAYATSSATLAGFFAYADEEPDVELVPLVYANLTPMGPLTAEAFDHLTGRMLSALAEQGPWDGVLLPQHGAAVADNFADADGEFIRRVREVVGTRVPIGVTLDLHANVSPAMIEHANVVTIYQTNPHVDARDQALRCARLLGRTIRGEITPRMALATPPVAINILRQGTAEEPMAGLLATARAHEERAGVLSTSVAEGFPYADVAEMGMTFLAVTDGDADLAAEIARAMADAAWERRAAFAGDALDLDAALKQAAAAPAGPVVLLDMGDNVGGGSPGDSTLLLHAARRLGIGGITQILCDPEAAAACAEAGTGSTVSLCVGGKVDDRHGAPIPVTGTVIAVTDGKFEDPTPTHGGDRFFDLGTTVGLRTDEGWNLVLASVPVGTHSQGQFRIAGIEPREQKIVIAKGVHSPRAGFEPIAAELVWVATPGSTSADLSTFEYRHRRRPMYPFEPDATF